MASLLADPSVLWCELAASREKFLFLRPPRFGKTTLVTGLASLFARGTEDFHGLAAQRLWREPLCDVVVLDFADTVRHGPASCFDEALSALLVRSFAPHGFTFSTGDVLDQLSAWLSKRPSNSLVLLIDNFEAPLAAFPENPATSERLNSFYARLKSREGCLRFFLMTGAASFESGRLFATFNITTNISYFPRFAALTGLTAAGLREAIAARGLLEEAAIESTAQALEAQFGRCCFDLQDSVPLCAPAPVRRFLEGPAGWAAASGTAAAALDGIAFASSSGRPRHEP